jgi:hypothetical protein
MYKINLNYLVCLVLFWSACSKPDYDKSSEKRPGIGIVNAFVLSSNYNQHNGNEALLYMDVGVVGSGYHVDITSIPDSAFKSMDFPGFELLVQSVNKINLKENNSYSTLFAIEGSVDWNDLDMLNVRSTSLNKSLLESNQNPLNEFGLATFSRRVDLTSQATPWVWEIKPNGSAFNQTYEQSAKVLYSLYNTSGISSNIYDAMLLFLDYTYIYASNTNQSVTFLCRNQPDVYNQATPTEVIERAKEFGIKINIIMLGSIQNQMALIALKTGGFINIIGSTPMFNATLGTYFDKGAPILGSLNRILSRNLHVYRVHFLVKKKFGNWLRNDIVFGNYFTNLLWTDGSSRLANMLPFYVEIP